MNNLSHNTKRITLIGIAVMLPFLLAYINPEKWWGVHFHVFLSMPVQLITIGIPLAILLFGIKKPDSFQKLMDKKSISLNNATIAVLSIIMGVIFYSFPIVKDFYGNARSFMPLLKETVTQLPDDFYGNLFSFEFEPGNGRRGVMLLYALISKLFGVSYGEVFRLMGAFCGAGFVFVWSRSVKHFIAHKWWQLILILSGICSPFLLIYYGHIDTYAPLYLILLCWLLLLVKFIKYQNTKLIIPLIILLFIGIRFHTLMYLLLPALGLSVLYVFIKKNWVQQLFSFKGMFLKVYLPICLAGLYLYVFVFKDYNDPRRLVDFKDIDRLFLPIFSPELPLDRYNLFSFNHILDYANAVLLWSPVLLFIGLIIAFLYRRYISKNNPSIIILFLSFIVFSTVLFMINPLMSMPMDWDLFLFPTPVLMVLTLLLAQQLEKINIPKIFFYFGISLSLISIPTVVTNHSLESSSYRMETVGKHVFKTYYEHSGTYLLYALQMIPDNVELYKSRKKQLIKDLKEYAVVGKDDKYASLLTDDGVYKLKYTREYEKARSDFETAHLYYPEGKENMLYLMEANFILKDFDKAYNNALLLMKMKYPTQQQSMLYGIHCSLEAEQYNECLALSNQYLQKFKQDQLVNEINQRLKNNDRVNELKYLFRQSAN